jgi:hypothetical protein
MLNRSMLIHLALCALVVGSTVSGLCTEESVGEERSSEKKSKSSEKHSDHGTKKDDHDHEHHHKAPHDGTLVVLGEEYAHVEFVLDAKSGQLTAYVLDGEAEKAVPLTGAASITLSLKMPAGKAGGQATSATVVLSPVANALTGETIESTSQFEGRSDALKGAKKFAAKIANIKIRGSEFKNVDFKFPEGNE